MSKVCNAREGARNHKIMFIFELCTYIFIFELCAYILKETYFGEGQVLKSSIVCTTWTFWKLVTAPPPTVPYFIYCFILIYHWNSICLVCPEKRTFPFWLKILRLSPSTCQKECKTGLWPYIMRMTSTVTVESA